MNFVEWQLRQGHKVISTESSYWVKLNSNIYQAFPYHKLITPSADEIQNFFRQSHALAARYSIPINQPIGQLSYHVIYDQEKYELYDLPKKVRHDVTKGLQYGSYESIPMSRLAFEGWFLRKETLIRQGRQKAESKDFWESMCLSADGLKCFEAWGALHEGILVAALLACTIGDTVSIFYQQSRTQHLKYGINNALTFTFTQEVLNRPEIRCIFYGLHSLDAPASVDEYKFRMGYSAYPVRQRVIFNPLVAPFIQPISHLGIKTLMRFFPSNNLISKAEGMIRFYLQGKLPLVMQEWPPVLQDRKDEIMALVGK